LIPKVLIYHSKLSEGLQLEKLAESRGFQVKSTPEINTALEWAGLRKFDLVLVPAGTSLRVQQNLAEVLWQSSPAAGFVLYELDGTKKAINQFEARLAGAEVFQGREALENLGRRFDMLRPELSVDAGDFAIMVVEDLDSPRDIICSFVEAIGYPNVTGMRSAKEALEKLQQSPEAFSCILTDIKMPGMNGRELIEKVRADPRLQHLPIVVITALGTADTLLDCLRAGASGFLLKPPRKSDMTRELARALRVYCERLNPRLVDPADSEALRDFLLDKGMM